MQRASVRELAVRRDRAHIDRERRRFFYSHKGLHWLTMKIRLRELKSFPRDARVLVIAPLAPVSLLNLVRVDASKNFFDANRSFIERAGFPAARFSAFCHDLNTSILDAHVTIISA
jgi:hypothetical protein